MAQGCVAKALLAPWPLLRPGVAEGRSKNLRNNLMSLQHMHQAPRCGARMLAEHRRCPMGAAVSTEESRRAHLAETRTRLSTGATRQRRSHNGGRWPLSFGKRNRWRIFLCHRLLSGRRAAAPQPAGVTREQPWPLKLVGCRQLGELVVVVAVAPHWPANRVDPPGSPGGKARVDLAIKEVAA